MTTKATAQHTPDLLKIETWQKVGTIDGRPVLMNPGNGLECVQFRGSLFSIDAYRMEKDRLIHAAAPEMLDAIKTILDDAEHSWLTYEGRLEQVKATARALLARIEGR